MKKLKVKRRQRWKRSLPIVIFLVALLMVVFAAGTLWDGWRDDLAARNEYADLHSDFEYYVEPHIRQPQLNTTSEVELPDIPLIDMRRFVAINPDFVGWIVIPGTSVSYPVVQGVDNIKYLSTTFGGAENPAGAIFMDYRTTNAFDAPITILHGHNMRDGSMFAPLQDFLDPIFSEDYSEIIIITAEGEVLRYEIFHVRRADAWDNIYSLDMNDPAIAQLVEAASPDSRILLLSTCYRGGDPNARLLVYASSP